MDSEIVDEVQKIQLSLGERPKWHHDLLFDDEGIPSSLQWRLSKGYRAASGLSAISNLLRADEMHRFDAEIHEGHVAYQPLEPVIREGLLSAQAALIDQVMDAFEMIGGEVRQTKRRRA